MWKRNIEIRTLNGVSLTIYWIKTSARYHLNHFVSWEITLFYFTWIESSIIIKLRKSLISLKLLVQKKFSGRYTYNLWCTLFSETELETVFQSSNKLCKFKQKFSKYFSFVDLW